MLLQLLTWVYNYPHLLFSEELAAGITVGPAVGSTLATDFEVDPVEVDVFKDDAW